jgi:exopolyphosphatase/pppGpp-phosphohydrolase
VSGALGVVDVGGGSSELVVGRVPDRISWSASFPLGSGDLARSYLRSDPPLPEEI